MKSNLVVALLATLTALCTSSCGNPEQKIRLTVTDESGAPIKDAKCMAVWWKDVFARDTTDAKGVVEFQGRTGVTETLVKAETPGYYPSDCYKFLMGFNPKKSGDRWEPWPVELNFVMKRLVRPHPMYFVTERDGARSIELPEHRLNRQFGYDLVERDWVMPHGKGKSADFLITGYLDKPEDTTYSPHSWVVLKFTNPRDGIIEYQDASSGGSILQGPHEAPEGEYQPEMKFASWIQGSALERRNKGIWSPSLYVFRVRTVTDEEGRIVSARYGKLMGGIEGSLYYKRPCILMTYYLNGTDNDRGLEWDMKNNLFKDLQDDFRNWGKP